MNTFERKNMETQNFVLSYRTDLYFHDYSLTIELDGFNHFDRDIDNGIKRKKSIEEKLNCKFISIDSDENSCNIFKQIH